MTKQTRRRLLLTLVIGVAVLACAVCVLWPRSAITRANAERIRVGMTVAEVDTLLGGPARDDSTGPVVAEVDEASGRMIETPLGFNSLPFAPERHTMVVQWQSDEVNISVHFDREGRVDGTGYLRLHRAPESLLAMLRRWLRQ